MPFQKYKEMYGHCLEEFKKDGRGWLVVGGLFVHRLVRSGYIVPFGLLVAELKQLYDMPMMQLIMIGMIPAFIQCSLAFIPTILLQRIKTNAFMWMLVLSTVLSGIGLLTSAYVPTPLWLFLTYSIFCGFGQCFGHLPSYTLADQYFPTGHKHHVTALSILSLSSKIGYVLFTPLMALNIRYLGWRKTFLALGVGNLCICSPLCILFKDPPNRYLTMKPIEMKHSKEKKEEISIKNSSYNINTDYQSITTNTADTMANEKTNNPSVDSKRILQITQNQEVCDETTDNQQVCKETAHNTENTENKDVTSFNSENFFHVLKEAGKRKEIIIWWFAVGAFSIVYYGPFMYLTHYFESLGFSDIEAAWFFTICNISVVVIYSIGCVFGRMVEGYLVYLIVISNFANTIVLFIWPFVNGNKLYHEIMSLFLGVFTSMANLFVIPCSHQITALEIDVSFASSMTCIGIGSLLTPFFIGSIYDYFSTYMAPFMAASVVSLTCSVCFTAVILIQICRNK